MTTKKSQSVDTEEKSEKDKSVSATASKLHPTIFIVPLGLLSITLFYSCLIHFTNLRLKIAFDPLGSVIYKARSLAASTDVERAHFHIAETERITADIHKSLGLGTHIKQDMKLYEKMIWHNDQATKHMLAAESTGTVLNDEGLIKRLCDSLGAQYTLLTGATGVQEEDKLYTRVNNGEDLATVFNQIQEQLQFAMNW